MVKAFRSVLSVLAAMSVLFFGYNNGNAQEHLNQLISTYQQSELGQWVNQNIRPDNPLVQTASVISEGTFNYNDVPEWNGVPYVELNGNVPYFLSEEEFMAELVPVSYEYYSLQDYMGRTKYAEAVIGAENFSTEERGDISSIHPTGWYEIKKSSDLEINRSHLIAHMFGGDDFAENLITGTRYFNATGMLTYENKVFSYLEKSLNHILYRVTPVYLDDDKVARGVIMQAYSIEDNGEGLQFCVFVYNVDGNYDYDIDYTTGIVSQK